MLQAGSSGRRGRILGEKRRQQARGGSPTIRAALKACSGGSDGIHSRLACVAVSSIATTTSCPPLCSLGAPLFRTGALSEPSCYSRASCSHRQNRKQRAVSATTSTSRLRAASPPSGPALGSLSPRPHPRHARPEPHLHAHRAMHRPTLPLAAAAALVALGTVASSSSLAAHPRTGFLQDVLSSRSAEQNYCKVRPLSRAHPPRASPGHELTKPLPLADTADGPDPRRVLRL